MRNQLWSDRSASTLGGGRSRARSAAAVKAWQTRRGSGTALGKGQFIDWTKKSLPPKIRRLK